MKNHLEMLADMRALTELGLEWDRSNWEVAKEYTTRYLELPHNTKDHILYKMRMDEIKTETGMEMKEADFILCYF